MSEYVILQKRNRVVLPSIGDPDNYQDVSVWDNSEENMERFAASLGVRGRLTKPHVTKAVLVRHPRNAYNSNAISVSTPASEGGSLKKRHLGYLREHLLKWAGQDTLAALIDYAGGEVEVTIIVGGPENLMIDLPEGARLGAAVRDFLAPRGIEVSGGPAWLVAAIPKLHKHSGKSADTRRTLKLIAAPRPDTESLTALNVATFRSVSQSTRTLTLRDAHTGRLLGYLVDGFLNLDDERDREAAIDLLAAEGIPVDLPITDPTVPEDGTWPADLVPVAWVRERAGGLDLRARDPEAPNSQETFAIYNSALDVAWVEDSHLVSPALRFFHRMGVDPAKVGLPRKSWALDTEIGYRSLRDAPKAVQEDVLDAKPNLFARLAKVLPDGVILDEVSWVANSPELLDADPTFLIFEKYVRARADLFPQHTLTGASGPCQLCGDRGATFTTPISTRQLTYCHACLDYASIGLVEDRTRAAMALKMISNLEFDGQPMLEAQLTTLHINPHVPVEPALIDQLLALRFAVGRKRVAWTLLLEAAGFAEYGLRTSRGTLIRSRDGHLCLSMREKTVCDFLHQHDIAHDREPLYPHDVDYNPSGLRRADWVLGDGTLVELWGLPKDPEYAAKMAAKRNLAARHGLRLVELLDSDLPNLPAVLAPWIEPSTQTGWTWSPLLIATAEASAKEPKQPKGDNRGRNDYNAETQRLRQERCIEAVRLQAEGLSRNEIGEKMSAGPDSVKNMLRDGKFYADPTSDPSRQELARQAAAARDGKATRGQFQAALDLTAPKASEAWRDAGILFET